MRRAGAGLSPGRAMRVGGRTTDDKAERVGKGGDGEAFLLGPCASSLSVVAVMGVDWAHHRLERAGCQVRQGSHSVLAPRPWQPLLPASVAPPTGIMGNEC